MARSFGGQLLDEPAAFVAMARAEARELTGGPQPQARITSTPLPWLLHAVVTRSGYHGADACARGMRKGAGGAFGAVRRSAVR
jgi:hypothetical protein